MGKLVIVESPTKADTIKKYLGEGYIVKSSLGHIRDLQDKSLSIDIENGFTPEYVIPSKKQKVVAELKKAAEKADTVLLASDEDREGEAISWHLADTLGLDPAKTKRIVFHEITKPAILHAIENPRTIDMNLVNAQQARRVLDRLVGFEVSPVLWRKIQRGLSAGRVQSVALRLVVDKEREIMSFKAEPYYKVEACFLAGGAKVNAVLDSKFQGIEEARKFLEDSIGASYRIESIEKKDGTRVPAPPFTTSTMQQEASRKLHSSVSSTMRVAQSLYERGLITYMRTDSTNLSSLAINSSKKFIIDNFGEEYSHPRQYTTRSKGAQEAHEAIRPTFIDNTEIEGSPLEKKLYALIWKRTVASQMSEARTINTSIKVAMDKRVEKYSMQATEILFDGFLKLYMESSDDNENGDGVAILPELHLGDVLVENGINAECKFTQPPYRYSEATIIKKLEELGIGRPSTYSTIITTLTSGRGYIVKGDKEGHKIPVNNLSLKGGKIKEVSKTETVGAERGKLLPQDIGIMVTDYLVKNFTDIMDYDFTANVEKGFDKIAEGKMQWNSLISKFYTPFHSKVDEALSVKEYSHLERELGTAPDGQKLIARYGQFGPYVQKGEGEEKQSASLAKGQLIESITIEEALKLFELPRNIGQYEGVDIIAMKGRYGAYLKYGDRNISLPRGADPLKLNLEEAQKIVADGIAKAKAVATPLAEWPESDIAIINGIYGPYIKQNGKNYKIPRGTDATSLTEEACKAIIAESEPTGRKFKKYKKSK